jgi:hypothetical protein
MYDFRLETQRDVAVYVSTLFTLIRDAHENGALDACRFLRARLVGMVPADALTAFFDGLGGLPVVDAPTTPKPEPARVTFETVYTTPAPAPKPARRPQQSSTLAW